jgi:hypothetical protein
VGHVTASELTSARRRGPGPWDMCQLRSSPLQGGVVRSYILRGSVWMHILLLILTSSLYAGYSVFRVPIEAPEPTSGEAANPQMGPIFRRPARLS